MFVRTYDPNPILEAFTVHKKCTSVHNNMYKCTYIWYLVEKRIEEMELNTENLKRSLLDQHKVDNAV